MKFAITVHNHQPAGNFECIFEQAYQKAYWPFLKAFSKAREVKLNLHNSGLIWEFVESRHPEYVQLVEQLIEEGRLELLTGGYYEPILSVIPDEDKLGQIRKMTDFLTKRFGTTPTGLWLPERVWEPHLPRALAKAGIRYVIVDDTAFRAAGVTDDEMNGYFMTEELGHAVAVVPINRQLRWAIPFESAINALRILESANRKNTESLIVFADDGEKFGIWPGTEHVYTEGWLKGLLGALDKVSAVIETVTLGKAIAETPPRGRVYLPASAYPEMGTWALPPSEARKLSRLTAKLRFEGLWDRYEGLIQGGTWRGFLARYPEANRLHKRMLQVSARLHAEAEPNEEALDLLWRAQTNCGYWHGVFGGLYLSHLRATIYASLLKVEAWLDRDREAGWGSVDVSDWDADGHEEVSIQTAQVGVQIAPALGGALFELDYKPRTVNLADTVARRPEVYHERELEYDRECRDSFLDRFYDPAATITSALDIGEFASGPYEFKTRKGQKKLAVHLERQAPVLRGEVGHPVLIEKEIEVLRTEPRVVGRYKLTNKGRVGLCTRFGVEFNLGLLSGESPDELYVSIDSAPPADRRLGATAEHEGVRKVTAHDRCRNVDVSLGFSRAARLWRYPVQTPCRGIDGPENVFQALCLQPVWDLDLLPGEEFEVEIDLALEGRA